METVTLTASHREGIGKNKVKAGKAEGIIPGIIYGSGKENLPVSVVRNEIMKAFKTEYGPNVVIDLKIKDKTEKVIAYQIEMDPIKHQIIHVDFIRVDNNKTVKLNIPTRLQGNAPGVKMGGLLIKKMDFVTIRTTIDKIPTHFDIDISSLGLDTKFSVSDIQITDGIETISHKDDVIVRVAGKRGKQETEETEGSEEGENQEGTEESESSE